MEASSLQERSNSLSGPSQTLRLVCKKIVTLIAQQEQIETIIGRTTSPKHFTQKGSRCDMVKKPSENLNENIQANKMTANLQEYQGLL
ncbi:MAG: hypothetical protein ACLTRS_05905 [Lachnospiraceae bacterium]